MHAVTDPTSAGITAQGDARDQLRAEIVRLVQELSAVTAEVEVLRRDRARLAASAEQAFEQGYDQAVSEIHDHFAHSDGNAHVAVAVAALWGKGVTS